jgi:hypothetical protein
MTGTRFSPRRGSGCADAGGRPWLGGGASPATSTVTRPHPRGRPAPCPRTTRPPPRAPRAAPLEAPRLEPGLLVRREFDFLGPDEVVHLAVRVLGKAGPAASRARQEGQEVVSGAERPVRVDAPDEDLVGIEVDGRVRVDDDVSPYPAVLFASPGIAARVGRGTRNHLDAPPPKVWGTRLGVSSMRLQPQSKMLAA